MTKTYNPFITKPGEQRTVVFEMTRERKARIAGAVKKIMPILTETTADPLERLIIVQFIKRSLERDAGFTLDQGVPLSFDDLKEQA